MKTYHAYRVFKDLWGQYCVVHFPQIRSTNRATIRKYLQRAGVPRQEVVISTAVEPDDIIKVFLRTRARNGSGRAGAAG